MQQLTCANSGNSYTGQFCNACRQKQVHRYAITHVLHELLHIFTLADKGVFSFGWQVLTRSRTVALAARVKEYTKSVFGFTAVQYKQAVKIKFKIIKT